MTMKIKKVLLEKGLTNKPLKKVKGVVIHWVANPNTSAMANRNYWEGRGDGVGAHYIIDLDGTVYQCVPDDMMAYQVGSPKGYTKEALARLSSYPNDCVIGIECTHIDDKGKMTDETYKSLVELSAHLLKKYKLTEKDLWLHSEIVGKEYKDCHRWFTTTKPEDWVKFKKEVGSLLKQTKTKTKTTKTTKTYTSLVDYLKDHNMPSDFTSRAKLARKYGINNYGGSSEQNIKLLKLLQEERR